MAGKNKPETPDGRYFVSKGKLWRRTNPALGDSERRALIKAMMQGRRAWQLAENEAEQIAARERIDAAKTGLGERGPVWWSDGAPDENGLPPEQSSYRVWWDNLAPDERSRGGVEG